MPLELKEKPVASLIIHGADKLSTEQWGKIEVWLRRQIKFLKTKRNDIDRKRFTARLMDGERGENW